MSNEEAGNVLARLTNGEQITFHGTDLFVTHLFAGSRETDGSLIFQAGPSGYLLYGPYLAVPDGVYELEVDMSITDGIEGKSCGHFELFSNGEMFGAEELKPGAKLSAFVHDANNLEIRLCSNGRPFVIRKFLLTRVGNLPKLEAQADACILAAVEQSSSTSGLPNLSLLYSTGKRQLSALWTALHSACGKSLIGDLAGDGIDFASDAISEWLHSEPLAEVIDVWEKKGLFAHHRLEEIGINPASVRLGACDDVRVEQLYAHQSGYEDLCTVLRNMEHASALKDCQTTFLTTLAKLDRAFQTTILSHGVLFHPCPISGRIIASHHAIPVPSDEQKETFLCYFFRGVEPFYVVVGGWIGAKQFLYMPSKNLVLRLLNPHYFPTPPQHVINILKRWCVSHALLVFHYFHNTTNVALLLGTVNNLGHFFWNEQTGLLAAETRGLLPNIHYAVIYKYAFLDPFSTIKGKNHIEVFSAKSEIELFEIILRNRMLCVRPTGLVIGDELVQRIRVAAAVHGTEVQKSAIAEGKKREYLLWVNLRAHNKVWANQVEGVLEVTNRLRERYSDFAVFFDGTPDCQDVLNTIKSNLPAGVLAFDGLGLTLYDSVNWAFAADSYLAVIGSGLTLVTWLAALPGVAHSERAHLQQMAFWSEVRKNAPKPLTPAADQIEELGHGGYCDYQIDPKVISDLVLKVCAAGPRRK